MLESVRDFAQIAKIACYGTPAPTMPVQLWSDSGHLLVVSDVYVDNGVLCFDLRPGTPDEERHAALTTLGIGQ